MAAWRGALVFSPDGRALAVAGERDIVLYDLAIGRQILDLSGYAAYVNALTFSPDGKTLASGHHDTTVLLWNVPPLPAVSAAKKTLSPAEMERLWQRLADAKASEARQALGELIAAAEQAGPFLAARLRPVAEIDPRSIQRLIRDLDADAFAVREQAQSELKKLGMAASRPLQEALEDRPSLEARRRIELLLPALTKPSTELLRSLRAIEVLETIDTPEARRALETLARGATDSLLTRQARGALGRRSGIPRE